MHQLLQWMRYLLYPAAAFFLFWAGYQVLADTYISDASGKVLVVYRAETAVTPDLGDCSSLTLDMENQTEQALLGVCQAYAEASGSHPLLELLNLNDSADAGGNLNPGKAYEQLSAKVAGGKILGAVSLLTSPDSQPVVRLCRSLQIPLLLVLAANNDLLAPAEDTGGIVFRMIPTNGEQAMEITDWIKKVTSAHQSTARVAVFHEPNSFGEYLFRQINGNMRDLDTPTLYQFEVREYMEFADLMPELWCDQIDAIVYLGFAPRAMDLINKLKWYEADPSSTHCPARGAKAGGPASRPRSFENLRVLLSSGAYQSDLNDPRKFRFPFEIAAMLPVSLPEKGKEIPYTSQYGYDSYKLIARLASSGKGKTSGALKTILSNGPYISKTGHAYQFNDQGELVPVDRNKYHLSVLRSSPDPFTNRRQQ